MSVSIEARMFQQAEKFLKTREYAKACDWFEKYFQRIYKEGTEITPELAKGLLKYAEALISKADQEGKPGHYDEDDLETATEYILTARETFQNAQEGTFTNDDLSDTHTLLGRVCTMNNQFKRAANEFKQAVEISKKSEKPNAWRMITSNMVFLGGAYELLEKPKQGLEVFQEILKIINEQYDKEDEEGKKDIDGIKETVQERIKNLEEDVKEQEANKEDLKEEDNDDDEEEEEDDEEEEEEEEEEGGEEEEKKETIAEAVPDIPATEIKTEDDATTEKKLQVEENAEKPKEEEKAKETPKEEEKKTEN